MKDLRLITITLAMMTFVACGPIQRTRQSEDTPVRTPETENLLINLKKVSARGFMFGHHDDTNYGICEERLWRLSCSYKFRLGTYRTG